MIYGKTLLRQADRHTGSYYSTACVAAVALSCVVVTAANDDGSTSLI